ncbi:glycoside hydrolase family 3 C-terminal domain-containing protein [Bifidobacterium choerinum]|uniref:Beta-glucosidase n=1 Tax=Bifidobacterium choerinum TaxID=35760 RepID=A0A087ADE7_9BIFI|nr:glycoside hydrolase family 3 C-terminal domain-containing protein [Bifidobacterium choerinum]KFI56797.1 beta-glucosidase [Bifidobacterium choerinum]
MTMISEANMRKARELTAQLTLEEKIGMIHGAALFHTAAVERLGIPEMKFDDGPMGVRADTHDDNWAPLNNTRDMVSYLPSGSAVASTWNPRLAHLTGQVLGQEARGRGKDVILGPSLNIKRSPLCGRNFEYMSEDPLLTAVQGDAYIEGVQESDVAACPKHFAANSQETDRLEVDEKIGERALRELYLPAFRAAVQQAGALTIMGAYNKVNGAQCCESHWLLDEVLRDEWGFDGLVVSDWGGIKNTERSAAVGIDVDMNVTYDFDDYCFARPLLEAVKDGRIAESTIDAKVEHVLAVMDALNMLGDARAHRKAGSYATLAHARSAFDIARESIVLLKNDAQVLPLDEHGIRRLLIVGANADRIHSLGGGSAVIKAVHEISPLLGINGMLGGNIEITYAEGYYAPQVNQDDTWQEESLENSQAKANEEAARARRLRDEALALAQDFAQTSDPVIFIGGLNHDYDLEARDREDMTLPYEQDALIDALLDIDPDTVLVFVAGSPIAMPWADKASTIVWNWYNGMESGTALAETLFGRVSPSGHLPETFPMRLEDCPAHAIGTFGLVGHVDYAEDIYVGYRYYSTKDVPVRFCFGHGLTYTSFAYSDLEVRELGDMIRLDFHVTNTGARAGKAVPQVYVTLEDTGEDRPAFELRGFTKVALEPGERRQVTIEIPRDEALRYWSERTHAFALAPRAAVHVGESVGDLRLDGRIG